MAICHLDCPTVRERLAKSSVCETGKGGYDMLKSEQDTEKMEQLIKQTADQFFGHNKSKLVFEHDQWWVYFFDKAEEEDRFFSVVDAKGIGTLNGFYFEEV
jgi:hypothetical protein